MLRESMDKDWLQYQETITTKVRQSWNENIFKLKSKFATTLKTAIFKVKREYLEKHPTDQTILKLFAADNTLTSKQSVVSG